MPVRPTTDSIWTRLSDDLWRFIRRRVAEDHTAEDLLQETFVRVHRNLPSLNDNDRLAAWVHQIARNVINDHHRSAARSTAAPVDIEPAAQIDDQLTCLRAQLAEWLDELIRQLPDGYREAVQLSEIAGLPQQQVADRLGLSLSGAKSRIQRGRTMLKQIMEQCCQFELDGRGNIMDCTPRPDRNTCHNCGG